MPETMGTSFENPNLDHQESIPDFEEIFIRKDGKGELQELLKKDSFLEYLGEVENFYQVRGRDQNVITIPKERSAGSSLTTPKNKQIRDAFRWLALALLGMTLSGLGTLLFAPLAIFRATNIERKPGSRRDWVRARIALWISLLLLIPAALLAYLFWLHLRP